MASRIHLHQDQISDILAKLPVKSIKRFNCVHKSWYDLFQSHYFIQIHSNFSERNPSYLVKGWKKLLGLPKYCPYANYNAAYLISQKTLTVSPTINISLDGYSLGVTHFLCCANGILCMVDNYGVFHTPVVLWNIATKDFKVLNKLPNPPNMKYGRYGFGYDSKTNDYKVVRLVVTPKEEIAASNHNVLVEVYCLSTDSWRRFNTVLSALPYNEYHMWYHQVYLDGMFHWYTFATHKKSEAVVSFDISTEEFIITPVPDIGTGHSYLTALNGSIARIYNPHHHEGYQREETTYDVWVLGELGVAESWSKLFTTGGISTMLIPLGVSSNGEIFFNKIVHDREDEVDKRESQVECYDPITQSMKPFKIIIPAKRTSLRNIVMYNESLVSLM